MMPHAFAYQDDIIVIQEHKRNLKEVFRRLRAENLKVNADKCMFFRKELQYLGHRVTDQGIGTDPEKVAAIAQLKPPGNVKELRQYLGVASWYRRFVPDFATKGQLNIVADDLSRQPLQETSRRITAKEEGQPDEQQECRWVDEMRRKMKQDPQKYPDYLEEAGQLYRHIPDRAGNEDVLQAAGKLLTQVPEEPWATVCADFVGPLPRSKHGNSMRLVLVDRFSKWTEIVPLRRATTETLRKAVRERIVARYGVPKIMITDNGVQFTSRAFKRFLEELGVKQQLTAPYTPQENPTERANRTGREPRLPNTLFDEQTAGTGRCPQTPVENAEKLKEIFELVRRNMERAAQDIGTPL
ncbi:uncharacterized protein K02A2.6-like [Drosophila yakuba]|uniref:uncharacterized protein K02A2.6-like n=1 Tax=Drosophila yakuba TaxID=7245 RepID=UPI001C89A058|nr:uncharacterized protein K02A2.6-like [Drosophila yakuba]